MNAKGNNCLWINNYKYIADDLIVLELFEIVYNIFIRQ